jgi:hypothetical protein
MAKRGVKERKSVDNGKRSIIENSQKRKAVYNRKQSKTENS